MKVIVLKVAKAAIERKRYSALVLAEFDKQTHRETRQQAERKADIERAAKRSF